MGAVAFEVMLTPPPPNAVADPLTYRPVESIFNRSVVPAPMRTVSAKVVVPSRSPMMVLLDPVVIASPAFAPMPMFLVPEVLLSGNQAKIEAWRNEQSIEKTNQKRPDLIIK